MKPNIVQIENINKISPPKSDSEEFDPRASSGIEISPLSSCIQCSNGELTFIIAWDKVILFLFISIFFCSIMLALRFGPQNHKLYLYHLTGSL